MFDIGWSELMLIGIVALIVIGPKELPSVLRTVGRTVTKMRRMAADFQGQFQDALREADIADMRKEIRDVEASARSSLQEAASVPDTSPLSSISKSDLFDPLKEIREEIQATLQRTAPAAGASAAVAGAAASEAPAAPGDVPPPALASSEPAPPLPDPVFSAPEAEPLPLPPADQGAPPAPKALP